MTSAMGKGAKRYKGQKFDQFPASWKNNEVEQSFG